MADPVRIDPSTQHTEAKRALATVVASEAFAKSERLKGFLTYVVEEAIAGRATAILGKTIAQDVYGRDPTSGDNTDNVVRVDARRLRRKLEEHYAGAGASDPVRIVIEQGGYAPRFLRVLPSIPAEASAERGAPARQPSRHVRWAVAGIAGCVLLVAAFSLLQDLPRISEGLRALGAAGPDPGPTPRQIERRALSARSAASVQATNLCDQARGFLFPIADIGNQRLAFDTALRAIETDPGMACGYAGAAHALATMSLLAAESAERMDLRQRASELADQAVQLDPRRGWSQSAMAWAAYAAERVEEAERRSGLAVQLAPRDGNVLDFRALIAVMMGDLAEALRVTDPDLPRDLGSFRFARRNIRAVALFHLGEYGPAIASLENAIEHGDPVSALTLTYLSVSYEAAGNHEQARRLVRELEDTWPNARPDIALDRFYANRDLSRQVVDLLADAGWAPSKP